MRNEDYGVYVFVVSTLGTLSTWYSAWHSVETH